MFAQITRVLGNIAGIACRHFAGHGLMGKIRCGEEVKSIIRHGDAFEVRTTGSAYQTASVLLAIGRRGTPRKLCVEGEEQSKVVYRMTDPEQYRRQHVLVVGGGDSALEAATTIAQSGATVTLSHRGASFSRAKVQNRELVDTCRRTGKLKVLFESKVSRIGRDDAVIEQNDRRLRIRNDTVIVCAGGVLPTAFLKSIGIEVETKYGRRSAALCQRPSERLSRADGGETPPLRRGGGTQPSGMEV
jgi:thioredoxin reductase